MEKFEKIIHILERDEIPSEEKDYLKRIATEDNDIKNFISIYSKLKNVFNSSSHLDMEILAEFILYYDGDLDAAEYIPQITDKIEDHLAECSDCNNVYLKLNKEFQQIDNFISKAINGNKAFEIKKKPNVNSKNRKNNFRAAITAFILLIITYFGMMITSYFTTPFYKKNIFEFGTINNSLSQGRDSEFYQKGFTALYYEDYDGSIGLLMEDIILNQKDSTIFYSHYLLGIAYIKSSENNILGTFKSYDHFRINEGIHHLMTFIEKNDGDTNERASFDAHYYIAKAYLSIDAIEDAKTHLQIVMDRRGKYYSNAVEILNYFKDEVEFKSSKIK